MSMLEHLDRLIEHARTIQKTGVINMDFKAYDTKKLDAYAAEAKKRWGHTDAWRESQEKAKGKDQAQVASEADGLMDNRNGAVANAQGICAAIGRKIGERVT